MRATRNAVLRTVIFLGGMMLLTGLLVGHLYGAEAKPQYGGILRVAETDRWNFNWVSRKDGTNRLRYQTDVTSSGNALQT